MQTDRRAVAGSLNLPEGQPGKVSLLLVNVGLYFGVVLSEGVLLTAVDKGRDLGLPVIFGLFFAVLSAPGLLLFAFALGFVPSAWPWRRKRLLALTGSVVLVGGWLLVANALLGAPWLGWFIWSCVLLGLVAFGFVARIPPPNELNLD